MNSLPLLFNNEIVKRGSTMYNLREHNIAPYKEIVEAYNNGAHFVIYTCGTGVGKSYVASAVINTYDFQNVLYIVPSVSIIADLIHRAGYHKYLENNHIVFKTFNAFSTVEQAKEILSLYDFVIIDEVHHLGSEVYGCNIQEAMKEAPCQFLGLTATPIRESDNVDIRSLADVAVQGYTVADAITAGMMPKLEYVCCSPDLDDIEAAASCNAKLKTDYNASKSLMREIIETNKVSKWLVYFSRVQDIEDHYDLMQELFPDFVVIKVAVAYQNTDKVAALIQQFEKVVIMSCDAILEGVHTEGIQGIIIMRNVTVVSVFEQMIGRVCKIGNTENPIIIDCQNVWRLLKKKKYSSRLSENSVFEQSARDIFVTSLRNKRYIDIEQVLLEHQDSLSNAGSCEVDGVLWTWKSNQDLCKQLGKSVGYVSTLRVKGLSYPEIISRVTSTNSCEVDGVLWTWKSDTDLSKKLGKNAGFVSDNRQRGLSYPELIRRSASTTAGSCEVDGVLWSWKSDVDLCKQLGKGDTYVYKCRRKGLSYPKIIKQGLLTTAGSCIVDGVFWSWENEKDLSRKLGRNHGYVARLRQNGLSYLEIIRQGLSTTAGSCEVNGMLWSWKNNPDLSRQLGKNAAYVSTLRRDGLSYPEIIERSLPTINSCMVDGVFWEWENDADLGRKLGKGRDYIYILLQKSWLILPRNNQKVHH